jgi:nitroreductase
MKIHKTANTRFEINDLSMNRWSPRAFDPRPVEKEKLQRLFEAARWSPSSSNHQPWHFMLGLNGDPTWNKIYETLDEGNKVWNANVPILLLCFGRNIRPRTGADYFWYSYDCGQSAAHLSLEATHLGLFVHQMAGFDPGMVVSLFELPEHYIPLTAIAVGYQGDADLLPADRKKREMEERTRKEFDSFVFTEKFGQASGLF